MKQIKHIFLEEKKQRDVSVSILRISKKCYYENLDTKNITDNKKFRVTPFLKQSKIKHLYYIE